MYINDISMLVKEASELVGNKAEVARRIGFKSRQNLNYHEKNNSGTKSGKMLNRAICDNLRKLISDEKRKLINSKSHISQSYILNDIKLMQDAYGGS